jgi:3-dehydroquinate synthase
MAARRQAGGAIRAGAAPCTVRHDAGGMMDTITVDLGARSYPIHVGVGILDEVGARVREVRSGPRVAVLTGTTVGELYGERVAASLHHSGFDPITITIPDGEEHKNLAWLAFLYDRLIEARIDRDSALIALGGGVIGDLAGFAAATFLRGVPFVQVPTTLLAQVDASVGGKTGVNHPAGKNLIGAFYQPRLVLIDVAVLRTLPRRELAAGLAEVIKYGVILDPALFELLEERLDHVLHGDADLLVQIVGACCRLKAEVVREDETERGYRAVLNFGHTLGHAVEALTEYRRFLHGEAVAIGMAFAARLSQARAHCDAATTQRLRRLLKHAGLPTDVPGDLGPDALAAAIATDKKTRDGKVQFVCIERIGKTRFEYLSGVEIVAHL